MKKIPELYFYLVTFLLLGLFFIVQNYAAIITNDDWMLYNLIIAKDIYNTLILSYPVSLVITQLYNFFPSIEWYSFFLSTLLMLYSYTLSIYIVKAEGIINKIFLFIISLTLLTYLWLHITITALTIVAMIMAMGFINKNISYTLLFLLLAFLLRTHMMLYILPFWILGALVLKNKWDFSKKSIYTFVLFIALLLLTILPQQLDEEYSKWLQFNEARSTITDLYTLDKKNILTDEERFLSGMGLIQDEKLLSNEKMIQAKPNFLTLVVKQLYNFDYSKLLHYRLLGLFWLMIIGSFLVIFYYRKNWKIILMPLFIVGFIFLIIIRDLDRVTIPLFILWAVILNEALKDNKKVHSIFLSLFTLFFIYYLSSTFTNKSYIENTSLKKEARQLIASTGIACELSSSFPMILDIKTIHIVQTNFLFNEKEWLKINNREILPNNWISRHKYFYETHNITHNGIKRKFDNYHDFLLDSHTGFIGGKAFLNPEYALAILHIYNKYYLKDKPECKHDIHIVDESEHFTIAQLRVNCKQ